MMALRPRHKFNFVGAWRIGFGISIFLIVLAIAGLITSTVMTGSALTLGTEFSGGTSIQIENSGDMTEDEVTDAYNTAASSIDGDAVLTSVQSSTSATGENGFILRTSSTDSVVMNEIVTQMVSDLGISEDSVQVETIGASWGASVIWSSLFAFILSCVAILIVIAIRYRDPRMGVVALITLFHDLIIIVGLYAWGGIFLHMEITSDVIAALLAIIGYSLYDTIVVFHRINSNASPQMKCSLRTCANRSMNEIIVRSINTSITSALPVLFMLILGTDTLRDFAIAMFAGMVIGVYSTIVISAPIYTIWKTHDPNYARLEKKYPYEVEQPAFTRQMNKAAKKAEKTERKQLAAAQDEEYKRQKKEYKEAKAQQKADQKGKSAQSKADAGDTTKESTNDDHKATEEDSTSEQVDTSAPAKGEAADKEASERSDDATDASDGQ